MIAEKVIKSLAVRCQTTTLNVTREYLQHLFLANFYQQKKAVAVMFKGGTALRILYRSPRFSEDLDFSATLKNKKVIEELVVNTALEMEREGLKVNVMESKATSGGYLAILSCQFPSKSEKLNLTLEISTRQTHLKGEALTVISDLVPPYIVTALDREQLVAEKITTLLSRQKPRDFYDLYFMLRANLVGVTLRKNLREALGVIKKTKINFAKELKIFLPRDQWAVIREFPQALQKEIQRFI